MNARLRKSFGWYSGLVYQERFMANHFNCELDLLTVSESASEQNIAYERMKYFIHHILDDSILIASDDPALERYQATGARVIVLPDEPVDQIVGIMLYLKLNAIMENRMVVSRTETWSIQGDQTSYIHVAGENVGPNLGQDGWWVDDRPIWCASRSKEDGKIINLERMADWKDYGLSWDSNSDDDKTDSVVFARFDKNENQ